MLSERVTFFSGVPMMDWPHSSTQPALLMQTNIVNLISCFFKKRYQSRSEFAPKKKGFSGGDKNVMRDGNGAGVGTKLSKEMK